MLFFASLLPDCLWMKTLVDFFRMMMSRLLVVAGGDGWGLECVLGGGGPMFSSVIADCAAFSLQMPWAKSPELMLAACAAVIHKTVNRGNAILCMGHPFFGSQRVLREVQYVCVVSREGAGLDTVGFKVNTEFLIFLHNTGAEPKSVFIYTSLHRHSFCLDGHGIDA